MKYGECPYGDPECGRWVAQYDPVTGAEDGYWELCDDCIGDDEAEMAESLVYRPDPRDEHHYLREREELRYLSR